MARTNGPFGPSGAALRRRPGDDPYGAPAAPPAGQWPRSAHRSRAIGSHHRRRIPSPCSRATISLRRTRSRPTATAASSSMPAQQQWGQPQPDPRAYELTYQTYAPRRSRACRSRHRRRTPAAGLRRRADARLQRRVLRGRGAAPRQALAPDHGGAGRRDRRGRGARLRLPVVRCAPLRAACPS